MQLKVIAVVVLAALLQTATAGWIVEALTERSKVNQAPVIGILTQEIEEDPEWTKNTTYIPSAYVKFIESAGGRVIPIHYTHSFEHVEEIMQHINGILFTGGDLNLTNPKTGEFHPFTKLANFIFHKAIEMNDNGIVFPLWGTCQGHQLMMLLGSQNSKIIQPTPRWFFPDNLKFNTTNLKISKLFKHFPASMIEKLETLPLTYNIHNYGIHLADFYKEKELSNLFRVITTNIDDKGVEYLSITEAKNYPFYTVQFHPERNLYDFQKENTPHSIEAGQFANLLAQRFIEDAKKNMNAFSSHNETVSKLIQSTGILKIYSEAAAEEFYFVRDFP